MSRVASPSAAPTPGQTLVLIHGFGGHRWLMIPLARRLRKAGFHVQNWGYRSLASDIASHAGKLQAFLSALQLDPSVSQIHIVAHSMGCIVTRATIVQREALKQATQEHLGGEKLSKIVMICPPNHGSHIASIFSPWFGWLSKTLTEICDTPASYVNALPQNAGELYPLGVIAANGDFIVSKESTRLAHSRDHITLPGRHTDVLFSRQAALQVAYFLREDEFYRANSNTLDAFQASPGLELAACPNRPNCVCSEQAERPGAFSARRLPALRFEGTCDEALERVVEQLEKRKSAKIASRRNNYLHAEFVSPILGFIDDVEFLADEDKHELRFRSASRMGWYDFGANRRRMRSLCNDLCASGYFS